MSSNFIFVDQRQVGRGRSSPNRQRLIRRVKSFIKSSTPQNIGTGGVTGGGAGAIGSSPVKITGSALEEPFFAYARDGDETVIIIGNNEYDREDIIPIDQENQGGPGAGPGNGGMDDFVVNIARDEFLDLFFEDCELPNLTNERFIDKLDNKFERAGFSKEGTAPQLSIVRTYKQALGRRMALSSVYLKEKAELEDKLKQLLLHLQISEETLKGKELADRKEFISKEIEEINARLEVINRKLAFFRTYDNSDMRYRKREAHPLKTVDAVIIFCMDISGSMDREKKLIARRWFALLYAFIQKKYASTELVFIAHTDEVFEMNEGDFFSTQMSGGTIVSPALAEMNKIIVERYDPNQTNIYICHASDGDNWFSDNEIVIDELLGPSGLMNKIQFFNYVEVGKNSWRADDEDSELWEAYATVRDRVGNRMGLGKIEEPDSCYDVFKRMFKKAGR